MYNSFYFGTYSLHFLLKNKRHLKEIMRTAKFGAVESVGLWNFSVQLGTYYLQVSFMDLKVQRADADKTDMECSVSV